METYSTCCGEPNRAMGEDSADYSDIGICPDCRDNCEFVTFEELQEQDI